MVYSSDSLEYLEYCHSKLLPEFKTVSGHVPIPDILYTSMSCIKTATLHESIYHMTFGPTTANDTKGFVLTIIQYVGN